MENTSMILKLHVYCLWLPQLLYNRTPTRLRCSHTADDICLSPRTHPALGSKVKGAHQEPTNGLGTQFSRHW